MAELSVFPHAAALGSALADVIADGIARAAGRGDRYVLGCPGGRSPKPVYAALAERAARDTLRLDHVVIAMMDDYALAEGDAYRTVPTTAGHSVARFGADEIIAPLAAAGAGTPELWVIDAADPMAHERRLAEAGIDLFILASGSGDGHVAFNSPGTPVDARSRVVELPESTRRDNVRTHPEFGSADGAPRYGVTIGTGTIADYTKQAVMVAHGEEKRTAVARLTAAQTYDASWPATIVHQCREAAIFADRAAIPAGQGV